MGLFKRLLNRDSERQGAAVTPGPRPNPNAEAIDVTDATIGAVLEGASLPALVDFWAPWCGPCRMLGPIIDELAKTYDGRIVVARMNSDENTETVDRLGITGIPTVVLFKGGQEVGRVVGFVPRHILSEKADALL